MPQKIDLRKVKAREKGNHATEEISYEDFYFDCKYLILFIFATNLIKSEMGPSRYARECTLLTSSLHAGKTVLTLNRNFRIELRKCCRVIIGIQIILVNK
jgi:hypothetical protein